MRVHPCEPGAEVIVTALLAALALTAVGIIVAKVVAKASSITTGP